eukprot:sb/3474232/
MSVCHEDQAGKLMLWVSSHVRCQDIIGSQLSLYQFRKMQEEALEQKRKSKFSIKDNKKQQFTAKRRLTAAFSIHKNKSVDETNNGVGLFNKNIVNDAIQKLVRRVDRFVDRSTIVMAVYRHNSAISQPICKILGSLERGH